MAVKPIISTITPWDTTAGTNITFSYSGNLPVTAKAIIGNASTLKTVLTLTNSVIGTGDGRFLFCIDANVLKANVSDINGNGNKYYIQLCVVETNGSASPYSDKTFFWCFTTPLFFYQYPENGSRIDGASASVSVVYSQPEGEKIGEYRHYLYDNSKNAIQMSDIYYDDSGYDYTFKGLDVSTSYYIRCIGRTRSGIPLDTGYIHFYTESAEIENNALLGLESDDNATVYGTTNMILIEANEDPAWYVFINSLVQLIGKKITYETNYKIARDFTLQIKITKVKYNGLLLKMYNKEFPDCIITLDSYVFPNDYFVGGGLRYCLKACNGLATYVLYTPPLEDISTDDFIVVTIRRINNVFSLTAEKVEDEPTED